MSSPFDGDHARAFRGELRQWFADNLPAGWGTERFAPHADEDAEVRFLRGWQRTLYDGGWAGISWPAEYGGRGATLLEQAVFVEERDRVKAPFDIGIVGTQMVGPMLITFGTREQKDRYLRRILTGADLWCQGFSEPEAGSDLAGLRTRAVADGDGWRVSGQKVWTSRAQHADMMILLARTTPVGDVPHRGISAFAVPMDSPGLTVRPLRQINGSAEFCEVFLDEVPIAADALIGKVDEGWKVAMTTLSWERFATTRAFEMRRLAAQLWTALPEEARADNAVRARVLELLAQAHAGGLSYQRMVSTVTAKGEVGVDASAGKLFSTELGQRIVDLALSVLPPPDVLGEVRPGNQGTTSWPLEWVNGFKNTIAAGTSQVQRNIIGERVLGLPKGGAR
ncbi:acyl-CoA dehydrogenase family protein [Actinomadura livida]|uniref:Acyl-CoA dehydrogenase n=1 Tax=Actinomadura livida TaxID=79909 RepID=A0A7W7IAL8_9ACTN|nr:MULTISPECIES: acyl-CoA dehydrogenase family protein [Actinomadura]MBB4773606.1 alkylation response protein AidB-like acyl-CoA dehydrogenase [Actinomadura catellatispora]GGU09467.1 putative acyl-CoA dehydrogenase FadE17 [Actinomadura livida]